jgi:glycosyltransferase involved in cell wall biosynthesis
VAVTLPQVSVVIPCRNAEAWVGETVASVVLQADVSFELIVVDDGSDDRSTEIASTTAGGKLTVIRQEASGVSRARNVGTAAASAPFLQYLDADDVLLPGTLAARVSALERSQADVAYCDWQRWRPGPGDTFGAGEDVRRVLGDRPELELLDDAWWPPGALMYRRTLVDRLLPWREDLPVIQDARFQQDAAFAGARFVHVARLGLRYRVHEHGSLSRRDPLAFIDDCFLNISDLHARWEAAGTLDDARRRTLLRGYSFVVRSYFQRDREKFDAALERARTLDPRFVPDGPRSLRLLSRAVGYRAAEHVAARWRAVKVKSW